MRPLTASAQAASPCEASPSCAGRDFLGILARPHALDLLHVLTEEQVRVWRFTGLKARLRVSERVLSDRLKEFEADGLVERTLRGGIPPRVDYEATPRAAEAQAAFRRLDAWALTTRGPAAPT